MVYDNIDAYLKGVSGENKVAKILSKLDKEEYIVINNVLLKRPYAQEGEVPTTQIDHIVVSVYGIFTVETKNYTGRIYGNENTKKWKVFVGRKKYDLNNPLMQNYGHSKTIQKLLAYKSTELGLSKTCFDIYPIIAFSQNANIRNVTVENVDVVYFSDILAAIKRKSRTKCLTFDQVQRIAEYINELNIYSPEAFREHVDAIKRIKGEPVRENNWNVTVGDRKYAMNNTVYSETTGYKNVSNTSEKKIIKGFYEKNTGDDTSRKIALALSIIMIVLGILAVLFFIFCFGGSFLTSVFQGMVNSSNPSPTVQEVETSIVTEEIAIDVPQEKNITVQEKIYQPRTNVVNDIIYICHGSYYGLNPPYVDEDGVSHSGLIKMWCHFAFTDGVYIDINAKSYNELNFEYFASTDNWHDNVVTVQVYDLDTNKMIYESDCFEQGHTKTATVDISNCDNIRLKLVDANDGICYCCVDNIILRK